jgi:DNA-binding transcriptional regulator YiaG
MAGVFAKYIPKFEYELVALNRYDKEDLIRFGDMLPLIMLIDKIRKPEEMSLLSQLPQDYAERLALNIPEHLKKLLADVITVLLTRIHVPKQEIDNITEKIYERRIQEMFTLLEPYDVQETRRLEREKTEKEMRKEMQKITRAKDKEILEERKKVQAREMEAARKMRQKNMSDKEIAEILNIPIETLRDAH